MALNISTGFRVGDNEPIDSRIVAADETARFAISEFLVYEGLLVYQESDNDLYVLTDVSNRASATGWTKLNVADQDSINNIASYTAGEDYAVDDQVVQDGKLYININTITTSPVTFVPGDWEVVGSGNGDDAVGFTLSEDFIENTSVNGGTVNYNVFEDNNDRYLNIVFLDDLNANDQSRNLLSVVNFVTETTPPSTFIVTGIVHEAVGSPLRLHLDGETFEIIIGGTGDEDAFVVEQSGNRVSSPVDSLWVPYPSNRPLTSGTGHLYFSRAVDAVATISHHAEVVGEGLVDVSIADNTLTITGNQDDTKVNVVNGIVYQIQPAGALNTTQVSVESGGLIKSNVTTGDYQDRLYQNITNRTLTVQSTGYNSNVSPAPNLELTLEEGVTAGDFEIYVNAGRYDATNNPNGHLGIENANLFGVTEDAPDWSGLLAYTVDDVVNFRNNIYKRRTQNIIATTGVSIVPGFTTLVSFKNNVGITGALGYADTFSFADPNIAAPALTSGVVYRFTIGSGSTQYVVDADPGSTDVTANVGTLYGNGLQSPAASNGRIWQLRLLTPTGTIAPGYTIVSVGDTDYTTAQQAAAQTALLALIAGKPIGTAIDSLDEGDQISFGGSPNTAPSEDVSWELISNATLAASRYDLIAGQEVTFHQIPVDETTISLDRDDPRRQLFEGFIQGLITVPESELDRTITNGTQAVNLPNGAADDFSVGDTIIGRGASFPGIFVGKVVAEIPADTASQVRFRLTSLRQDDSEAIVALDDTTVIPGLGGLTRVGDIIQVARLEDVSPVTSIDEFNTTLIQNDSDQLPLGTNFEPSAQVTYLTSFAPRENVEYNGNFYFYIGPSTYADFVHEAALRPQDFTNADFVPGNNKLNWVTYNEFINDISEADRSYSERIAATRDVVLHAQVRREIEAAKQDVLLTLSDRDSEREDQLLNLRPTWRLANTRYDDGSRFRRNVLYSGSQNGGTYALTAGNSENARVYNSSGTTGTEVFDGDIQSTDVEVFGGNTVIIEAAFSQLLTQNQIQSVTFNGVNVLGFSGLSTYSIVTGFTSNELRLVFSTTFAFQQAEFLLRQEGRLIVSNTTIASTVSRKGASLAWVNFTAGSSSFTGEGLSISEGDVVGRAELISAIRTSLDPSDNNGVILGINHDDTSTHYFSTAKPWDDDYFTAVGDQAVHVTVSAGATGAIGATYDDTRVSALGAAQRLGWSTRTYANNPEDYFDLDPSNNEYIIDNYSFSATSSGLAITGALLEPAVKSYSGFIWITSNASNLSNNTSHDVNRVVQAPFRNVNTIDLSEYQYFVNADGHLEEITTATSTTQSLKIYGLNSESITAINGAAHSGSTPQPSSVDLRFMLSEPGVNTVEYQLSFIGATPYNTTTNVATVAFVRTSSTSIDNITGLERLAWELDTRAIGAVTRPTVQADLSTRPGSFVGAHGVVTNTGSYFSDSIKQWSATSGAVREINNSLFSRGETVHPDTVVRGSDGTYYKWTFRGVANSTADGIVIRYDNVQVIRGADGVIRGSSRGTGDGPLGSIYAPATADETVFMDPTDSSVNLTSITTLDDLNSLFQRNAVHPYFVEYDGYYNLTAGQSADFASIILPGVATPQTGDGITFHAELNRFVLMDPTALHAQATLVAGGSTNAQAIRDGHAFNNLWSVLEVDEDYPQYRSTVHNAVGVYQDVTLQYHVDASFLQGVFINEEQPDVDQILMARVRLDENGDPLTRPDGNGNQVPTGEIEWHPEDLVDTIPEHNTIPVTNPGANVPNELEGWELEIGRPGEGLQRNFLAVNGSSADRVDLNFIDDHPRISVTFANGDVAQATIIGDSRSTITETQIIARLDVARESTAAGVTEVVDIQYLGTAVPVSYIASPLTVNSDDEVLYDGLEIATDRSTWSWAIASTGRPVSTNFETTVSAVGDLDLPIVAPRVKKTTITVLQYELVIGTGTILTWFEWLGVRLNSDLDGLVDDPSGSIYSTSGTDPFTGASVITIPAF